MNLVYRIANKIGKHSPYFISKLFVYIPFKFRYGKTYTEFEDKIKIAKEWSETELENYIVNSFDKIFQHSKKFRLYKDKYEKAGVLNLVIKSVDDIKKIPILTRNEVQEKVLSFEGYSLEQTGGTSGNPLSLYLDKNAWAREWAHYHDIWKKVDYQYTDAKFVFRKQNLNEKAIQYNFSHNDYVVKNYDMNNSQIDKFFKTMTRNNVKYFHGYPSAINDFLRNIEKKISKERKKLLQDRIKCIFYASEMPLPHFVEYLKDVWGFYHISMYGHTEMCVLASTDKNGIDYYPFHTYGYVEVENNMLLGTSYHNFDMPLIRYNTDDLVKPKRNLRGIVKSFEVTEGRIFDFIIDKNDFPISITALFREEYHKIFSYIDYIQVFQEKKGYITILITPNKYNSINTPSLKKHLGKNNLDIEIMYLKEPIKTKAGKVPIRVRKLP